MVKYGFDIENTHLIYRMIYQLINFKMQNSPYIELLPARDIMFYYHKILEIGNFFPEWMIVLYRNGFKENSARIFIFIVT